MKRQNTNSSSLYSTENMQKAGAGDDHTLITPGGLCLVAENGDIAFCDASLLEVKRQCGREL